MNFIRAFKDGEAGKNTGLPTGLHTLDRAIDRVQRGAIYTIGASPKVGKSTLTDFAFIYNPYLHAVENDLDVDFIYYSLEMSRIKLEYKAASFFFYTDYGIGNFQYDGLYEGGTVVPISSRYLLHKLRDDQNQLIKVQPAHKEILKEIYSKRIIPMFGEYDAKGRRVKKGAIEVIEDRNRSTPIGVYSYLINYAKQNGKLLFENFETELNGKPVMVPQVVGYTPNNPDKFTIIVLDHIRKLKIDEKKRYTIKQNMDKMSEYQVFLRNICNFTFIDIIHLNRGISDINRIKFNGETLHPDDSDLKDSGNLSEDSDFLITMFDPHDKRYNLTRHMGLDIDDYPDYRSLHLVKSRDTPCPAHMQVNMYGNIAYFEPI